MITYFSIADELEEVVKQSDFELYIERAKDGVEEFRIKISEPRLTLDYLRSHYIERISRFRITSGYSGYELAKEISDLTGIKWLDPGIFNYANQQSYPDLQESVRGKRVIVVENICRSKCEDPTQEKKYYSGNDNYAILRHIIQTITLSWGRYIIGVTPYIDFSKQDRQTGRQPLPFAQFAEDIERYRTVYGWISMFPHCIQTKNAFHFTPVDYLPIQPFALRIMEYIIKRYKIPREKICIGAFDAGSVQRLASLSIKSLVELFINYKKKVNAQDIQSLATEGEALGFTVFSVDDFVHSGGTLKTGYKTARNVGGNLLFTFCGHIDSVYKVFTNNDGKIVRKVHADSLILDKLPLKKFIFSDSTPLARDFRVKAVRKGLQDKIMVLKASDILAHVIMRCVLQIPATEFIKW